MRSCVLIVSSCLITTASATHFSVSFFTYDFVHSPHFPGGTFLLFISNILLQTNALSSNTACIPFGLSHRDGLGWSVGYERSWAWPWVSGLQGFGGGLLSGICMPHPFPFFLRGCCLLCNHIHSCPALVEFRHSSWVTRMCSFSPGPRVGGVGSKVMSSYVAIILEQIRCVLTILCSKH